MTKRQILIVDDEESILTCCVRALSALPDCEVFTETQGVRALERLNSNDFDLLITDMVMPEMDGLDLLRQARQKNPDLGALIITGYPRVETAVECMKLGAADYISKPFFPEDLLASVTSLLERKQLREENRLLRRRLTPPKCCGGMLGRSAVMMQVCERLDRTAATDLDVLIVGETGTGKELVARAVHDQSRRKERAFVPVNCAAVPDELLESEFFGHERGAFTGAQSRNIGLLEFANGGTFFLDELNQLPMRLQGKLLRVVQERKIRRVGGSREIDIDVRLVAASSTSLEESVRQGQFRADLYHRLNVARLELPPLRDRAEDIPILANYFVERYAQEMGRGQVSVSPEVMEILVGYSWPGNVRELQNILKRTLAWAKGETLTVEDLPDEIVAQAGERRPSAGTGFFALREQRMAAFEKEYLRALLERCQGDVSAAAREAELPRGTLYRLFKKHDLNPAAFRAAGLAAAGPRPVSVVTGM